MSGFPLDCDQLTAMLWFTFTGASFVLPLDSDL